jgi:hypothetical protein
MDDAAPGALPRRRSRSRLRDRLLPPLTLVAAGLWAWGAGEVADHVRHINTARGIASLLTPRAEVHGGRHDATPAVRPLMSFLPMFGPPLSPAEAAARQRLHQQIGHVEGVVTTWLRAMYGVAGFLAAIGLFAWATRWKRPLFLTSAIVILVSAAGTFAAMRHLMDPDRGGLAPLSLWTHVAVLVVQTGYGWILLGAYLRKPRGATDPVSTGSPTGSQAIL